MKQITFGDDRDEDDDDARKRARRTDPDTSKQAARAISPHVGPLQLFALGCIVKWPYRTGCELSTLAGHGDYRKIGRRLTELERRGLIFVAGERTCQVTGARARAWAATEAGRLRVTP